MLDMNLSIRCLMKKIKFYCVNILRMLRIQLSCKVGDAKNKHVVINSGSALNVTVTLPVVRNLILKQPNIITLEKVQFKVRISQML